MYMYMYTHTYIYIYIIYIVTNLWYKYDALDTCGSKNDDATKQAVGDVEAVAWQKWRRQPHHRQQDDHVDAQSDRFGIVQCRNGYLQTFNNILIVLSVSLNKTFPFFLLFTISKRYFISTIPQPWWWTKTFHLMWGPWNDTE